MWEDPTVSEVRCTREKLSAEFNFDAKAIFAGLRRRQAALGGRLVCRIKQARSADATEHDQRASSAQGEAPAGGSGR